MRTERNYVNGRFVAPESDTFIVVHNPATEAPFARVPRHRPTRSPPSTPRPPRRRRGARCRAPNAPPTCTASPTH